MSSPKYKYIILSSMILGTVGLSSIQVNTETIDGKQEKEKNIIVNNNNFCTNDVENVFSESINSVDSEDNNLTNNSNSKINIGSTVIRGSKEKIGDWQVQWWIDGGYSYCELLEYQGNSLNIDLNTDMGNIADNVILDTSNLKKIIPNYKNIENINLGRSGSGFIKPSKVQNNQVTAVTSIDFSGFTRLQSVTLNKVDTSRVTSLSNMFADCSSLISVNLSSINTWNVTSFRDMFARCTSLKNLNLKGNNFNTSRVTDMQGVFYQCSSLQNVDLSFWDTSKVSSFQGMFQGCRSLNSLNLSNFNTINANTMQYMFADCANLSSLNLSNWKTQNVSNFDSMFKNSPKLNYLDLSSFVLKDGVNDSGMFTTSSQTELLVLTNDAKLKNLNYTSRFNRVPLHGPVLDANGGKFSDNQKIKKYFDKCAYEPNKINLEEFNKFKNANQPTLEGKYRFTEWQPSKDTASAKTVLDLIDVTYTAQYHHTEWNYQWDSSDNCYKLTEYIGTNTNIVVPNEIVGKPTKIDLTSAFPLINLGGSNQWTKVTSVRFSNDNGKKVKAIGTQIWFNSWSNMTDFDGSGLDISNVNKLERTFENCSKLRNVNLSGWNTSNITNMYKMFANCSALETINVKHFNTARVTNMQGVFSQCSSLRNLDLSAWNTINVTNFADMFNGCSNMTDLNVGGFATSNATSMQGMFKNCPNLKILDLSSFTLREGVKDSGIFTTSEITELLVLANDEKLKSLNYETRFNRVPLNGPVLDANGGKFSGNTVIKKYFEKCAYEPRKIELAEFEKFKNENQPSNEGFDNRFIEWRPSTSIPDNITSVLDLINITYQAQWENADWDFEENDNRILLTRYKGTSNEVIVPTKSGGKNIVLKDINTSVIPHRVQKFSVDKSNSNKLTIEDSNLNLAFDGNTNLREVDLSGVDMTNITHMGVMFRGCSNLVKANFSECDFKKLITMEYMFQNCNKLSEVNFSNVNTPVLNNAQYMFSGCTELKVIDLSSFTIADNLNDKGMFTTDEKTELLLLTNSKKLKDTNYDKRFNRIPLDGPVFNAGAGNFENSQNTKKYFEKCAYDPSIISIENFNSFKESLTPTRTEFATTFVSWEPEQGEPQNPTNVLDLGNMTYKATWSDPNWDFTETDDEITLTRYKGTSNEINLSAVLDNKQVTLKDINNNVIPTTITKFILKEKNGKKVKVKDTNLSQGFLNNTNLTEVNLSGLDSSLVTNLQELFKNCSNLLRVTLTGMNTQNVSNFKSMFYECSRLSNVNVTNLNTASVTDMSYLFYNCYALKDINLAGWNTTKVQWMGKMFHNTPITSLDISHFSTPVLKSTNRMFNGCNNLKIVRMDNFDMSHNTDSAAMFYRGKGTETLVVTKDNQLLTTYPFKGDNTHPLTKPALNANGGEFENNQKVKNYFEKVAVLPADLQLTKFEEFKNTNIPTKSNSIFRRWEETISSKSSEAGVLDLLDKSYMAIWKNMICNTTVDNKKITTEGNIGFVYLPNKFFTAKTKLQEEGEQIIPFNKKESLNIGVRDLSQSTSSWSVTGQLNWLSKEIPGAYIQIESNKDSIKKNINDNVKDFDSSHDLVDVNEEVSTAPSSDGYLKITSNSTNRLIEANTNKTHDEIYDYNLGNASLVIPNTKYVQAGEHTATVEWNLTNAPQ
ncbi:TPA: BspA family leucine-rich repeat surface protein [Enterococcus faecium]